MAFWNKDKEKIPVEITKPVVDWEEVDSSFVKAIAYDDPNDDLYVTLSHGSYVYHGVPKKIFEGFLDASSKGSFFNRNVNDTYTFTPR